MDDDLELWTERQATEYLRLRWTGRDATRSALKAGIAGAPVRVRNALLYRADDVRAALDRTADPCEIAARVDTPVFVARMAPRAADPESSWRTWRGADVLAPRAEQVDAARAWWHLGERLYVLVRAVASAKGMPFVVTWAPAVHPARDGLRAGRAGTVVQGAVRPALEHGGRRAVPGHPRVSDSSPLGAAWDDGGMNPRHRRLVIPVALGALILIVVLAAVL